MNLFKYGDEVLSVDTFVNELKKYISEGETIYLEIDTTTFGRIYDLKMTKNEFLSGILSIFRKIVGDAGTIVCPAFSYSWGADSVDKIYSMKNTRSKVGIFPEFFRKENNVERTNDPMFSFLAQGPKAQNYSNVSRDTFGRGSLFEKLYRDNAKLISFGLNKYDPTFVHYVEQYFHENIEEIDYRFVKEVVGKFEINGEVIDGKVFTLLRYPGSKFYFNDQPLVNDLRGNRKLVELKIGGGAVSISDCDSVFKAGISGMKKNKHYFVRESQ